MNRCHPSFSRDPWAASAQGPTAPANKPLANRNVDSPDEPGRPRPEPRAQNVPPHPQMRHVGFRTAKRSAFTLIEVLTTMVVMAIVLPIAMHGISVSLQAAEMAKRTALAATLADGKLNDLVSNTSQISAGSQSGDFSPDYPGYQWQATTTSLALGLEQIDVQVTWRGRDGDRKVTVSTVIYPQGGTSS